MYVDYRLIQRLYEGAHSILLLFHYQHKDFSLFYPPHEYGKPQLSVEEYINKLHFLSHSDKNWALFYASVLHRESTSSPDSYTSLLATTLSPLPLSHFTFFQTHLQWINFPQPNSDFSSPAQLELTPDSASLPNPYQALETDFEIRGTFTKCLAFREWKGCFSIPPQCPPKPVKGQYPLKYIPEPQRSRSV